MRDNRFTYLCGPEDDQLRAATAQQLGVSQSDVVRLGVRKLAGELGITAPSRDNDSKGERDAAEPALVR